MADLFPGPNDIGLVHRASLFAGPIPCSPTTRVGATQCSEQELSSPRALTFIRALQAFCNGLTLESTAGGCEMQKKLQQAAHITRPHARW